MVIDLTGIDVKGIQVAVNSYLGLTGIQGPKGVWGSRAPA